METDESELEDNINENAEPFMQILYAMKDRQNNQKNVDIKILRALRNHEKRLVRLEQQAGIVPSKKELADYKRKTK